MIAAPRYAKALIDLAVESGNLEEVRKDMQLVKEVCENNREFVLLLQSPVVKADKKSNIISAVFEGKLSKTTAAFLQLLTSKRRENYLEEVAAEFDRQYRVHKNITTVIVESAVALDEKNRKQIIDMVKTHVSGEIALVEQVNPSLIGGFILKINDTQVDQSVRRKLSEMRKELSDASYTTLLN